MAQRSNNEDNHAMIAGVAVSSLLRSGCTVRNYAALRKAEEDPLLQIINRIEEEFHEYLKNRNSECAEGYDALLREIFKPLFSDSVEKPVFNAVKKDYSLSIYCNESYMMLAASYRDFGFPDESLTDFRCVTTFNVEENKIVYDNPLLGNLWRIWELPEDEVIDYFTREAIEKYILEGFYASFGVEYSMPTWWDQLDRFERKALKNSASISIDGKVRIILVEAGTVTINNRSTGKQLGEPISQILVCDSRTNKAYLCYGNVRFHRIGISETYRKFLLDKFLSLVPSRRYVGDALDESHGIKVNPWMEEYCKERPVVETELSKLYEKLKFIMNLTHNG